MKNYFAILLFTFVPIIFSNSAIAGRCSGGVYCTACSNCSSCKNCSEEGGSCSVCANYDEPETQQEVIPVPVVEAEPDNFDNSDDSEDYTSDYEATKEKKSSYSWLWWVFGIVGGLWLLGSIGGKK